MGKRSTKKRGRRKKGQTRRYRFRGGADCTRALETCDSLVEKLEPLAAEVRELHKHLKENAKPDDDDDSLDDQDKKEKKEDKKELEEGAEGSVGDGKVPEATPDGDGAGDEAEEPATEGTTGATPDGDGAGDPEVTADLQTNEEPDRQKEKTDEEKGEGPGGGGGSGGGWLEGFFAGGGRRKRRGRGKTRAIRRPVKRKSRRRK